MSRRYQHDLIAIERTCDDDPAILTIGNGIWISVGWNDAGLNLTGNELSPNDERIGIPREIQVRAMLRERTLAGMVEVALHPERASSYNNVLVDADRRRRQRRGVGDRRRGHRDRRRRPPRPHEPLRLRVDARLRGRPRVRRALGDVATRGPPSCSRARRPGSITMDTLHGFLADHEQAPDSLCRHEAEGRTTVTAFWCVADVTDGVVRYGPRQPLRFRRAGVPVRVDAA